MDDLIRREPLMAATLSGVRQAMEIFQSHIEGYDPQDDCDLICCDEYRSGFEDGFRCFKQFVVAKAPAVDAVEVRHGRWIFDFALGGSNFYKCSECGRQECLLEKYNAEEYMPYCHCGARMDRRREDGDGG